MSVSSTQRFSKQHPCPICEGYKEMPQGQGTRCWGYLSEDGQWAYCTRPEHAGPLNVTSSDAYAHKLYGDCHCGVSHRLLVPKPKVSINGGKQQNGRVIRHEIRDMDGTLIAFHCRTGTGPGKRVWWELPDGTKSLGGLPLEKLPLYGAEQLKALPDGSQVVVTEGESARDALQGQGIFAVGTVTGAKTTPSDDVLLPLVRLSPALWHDNDSDGRGHMAVIARLLNTLGCKSIKIIDWPHAPNKGDAADAVTQGVDVREIIAGAEEWDPADVNLAALLDDVVAFVRRYVVLTEHQSWTVALWTAHTHAFEAAECTPYLDIHSPEKRSGKTRLLETLALAVAKPWLTGRVTAAVLIRKVARDCPTLLLDETDAAFKGQKEYAETLRSILNAGYRRGGVASVCVKQGSDYELRDFSVFGPKALAGIGKLPDTVSDRSIPIQLRRKAPGEHVERLRMRESQAEAAPLRDRLETWSTQAIPLLEQAKPEMPSDLDDRATDTWEPLFAIADAAGGHWPARAREAALALSAGGVREDDSLGVVLLRDIWGVFRDRGVSRMSSAYLVEALVALEEAPWGDMWGKPLDTRRLAKMLRPYGIRPHVVRIGDRTPKGYDAADFVDTWRRYIPSTSPQQGQHPQHSTSPNATDVDLVDNVEDLADSEEITVWTG